jgi:hypothetical protein
MQTAVLIISEQFLLQTQRIHNIIIIVLVRRVVVCRLCFVFVNLLLS